METFESIEVVRDNINTYNRSVWCALTLVALTAFMRSSGQSTMT